jgi:hypothetical protein
MKAILAALILCAAVPASARDDGRYAGSPYKSWYESQHNAHGGYCCNEADGKDFYGDYTLTDDGGVEFDDGGQHYKLPPYMVLRGPNPTGHAVWWHLGETSYCFAIGSAG